MSASAADVEHEESIVWLEDASALKYVRETTLMCSFRTRPPRKGSLPGRVVGYATLKPTARGTNGFFDRRVFWLNSHDHPNAGPYANSGCPSEAVDPATVKPGEAAACTPRCHASAAAATKEEGQRRVEA